MPVPEKRGALKRLTANYRYFRALLGRFRTTVLMALFLFLGMPVVYVLRYVDPAGEPLRYGQALHHVYFLLYGEPSLPYVDDWLLEGLTMLIPPVGIALVVDGVVRFAYLFFARHRSDKEWIAVIAQTLKGHIIVCGAGRVGFRVASQLLAMGREVVVIEKREDAAFVKVLQDQHVPVLIDDTRSPGCLPRCNVERAAAIVCATDDDLANLNVALDARRFKPDIRVVIRLFDDDLVAKVKDTFKAEALSTSALAAPAMALSALDPRLVHSFQVGGHLMVVSTFVAGKGLAGLTIGALRDTFGAHALTLRRGSAPEQVHPLGSLPIAAADVLTLQCEYNDYLKLREHTGEVAPPIALSLSAAGASGRSGSAA